MRIWCSAAGVIVATCLALATGGCDAGSGALATGTSSPAASMRAPSAPTSGLATGAPSAVQDHSVQLTVAASGDLLIHSPVYRRALVLGGGRQYNFAPFFAKVRPYILGADLALCDVETPMTPAAPSGYPVFNTPPALATAIHQTGWRACSTASNHTLDQGQRGVDDTIRALNHAGVLHTGSSSSAAAQAAPLIMTIKGVRVAFLAYTQLTNGIPSPHPWSVNRPSAARILSDALRGCPR